MSNDFHHCPNRLEFKKILEHFQQNCETVLRWKMRQNK